MNIKRIISVTFASLFVLSHSLDAYGQNTSNENKNKPLFGYVSHGRPDLAKPSEALRIQRTNGYVNTLRLMPAKGQIDTTVFNPPDPEVLKGHTLTEAESNAAPYIWFQSRLGGYYDGSGNCKTVVPGWQLEEYGGKFADGTPVFGNAKTNVADHVYWKPGLNPQYFFTK